MKKLLSNLGAKIAALFLLVFLLLASAISALGIAYLAENNVYADQGREVRNRIISNQVDLELSVVIQYYQSTVNSEAIGEDEYVSPDFWESVVRENSNFFFSITDPAGQELLSNYFDTDYQYKSTRTAEIVDASDKKQEIIVTGYLRTNLEADDEFSRPLFWLDKLIGFRYGLIAVCALTLAGSLALLIFLICSAGHKEGVAGIHLNWVDRIPFDLYIVLLAVLVSLFIAIAEPENYVHSNFVLTFMTGIPLLLIGLSLLLSFTARAKAGAWWKNTLIYRLLIVLKKILLCFARKLALIFGSLPLFWKTGLAWAGLSLIELLVIAAGGPRGEWIAFIWLVEKIVITPVIIIAVINMRQLQKGGEEISAGNLAYKIDLAHMHFDFKKHGENLNNISLGLQKAVEARMKSERLKTELITNVSHDIKTPLTSIVNYVDLLKREEIGSEKVQEYVQVLDRQSARLKKITEDLVEASKASTGNIPVFMEPTDVNVLLAQAAGEYEDKFKEQGLELVLTTPEQSPPVFADGKLLWRVFDNLLSNICKYAQKGTRVYLSSEIQEGRVQIVFKNISRYALNITGEELMERFVRGDASRSTEGSGLGLSIARSLTELQRGTFDIKIDGDLFKAVVSFAA